MKNKRILLLLNSKIYSGAESVVLTICKHLKEKYDFVYVTQEGPIVEVLKERKVPYFIINKMSKSEVEKAVEEIKPDIIHTIDFRTSLIAATIKQQNIKKISHLHNNPPWIKKALHPFSISYFFATKKYQKIATVSDAIEKEFVYSKWIKNKIVNVGNPIERKTILDAVQNCSNEIKYDVCFVGRLEEEKNPLVFIEIIKKIKENGNKEIKAVMVGTGSLKEVIQRKIKENCMESNIELVGFQKNPYTYMNQSKVFCLPSIWEGFGLVAFEALTLGKPCVVAKVGGLVDIVDESCGSLCTETDGYVKNIQKLLKNSEYYNEISKNAILKSKKIENIDNYMKKIEEIYENL